MDNALSSLQGSNHQARRFYRESEENSFIPEAFLCSLLFTVLGIGYLLPWNAFLSATSYFNHRLCSSSSPIIQNQFEAIFGLVYNISATISLATMVLYLSSQERNIHGLLFSCLTCLARRRPSKQGETTPYQWYQNLTIKFLYNLKSLGVPIGLLNQTETPVKQEINGGGTLGSDFLHEIDATSTVDHDGISCKDVSYFPLIFPECYPPPVQYEVANNHNLLLNSYTDVDVVEPSSLDELKNPLLNQSGNMTLDTSQKYKQPNRLCVFLALASYLFAFIVTISLALLPKIESGMFFFFTVLSLVVCGASSAVYTAEVLNFASTFPPTIGVKPYVAGHALAGVITSLVKLCLLFEERTPDDRASNCSSKEIDYSALVFFAFGSLVILCSLASFYMLNRLPITKFYEERELFLNKSEPHQTFDELHIIQDTHDSVISNLNSKERTGVSAGIHSHFNDAVVNPNQQAFLDFDDKDLLTLNSQSRKMDIEMEAIDAASCSKTVLEQILIPAMTCFIVLFVTLSVFPSWTYQIQRVHRESEHHTQQSRREEENVKDDLFFAEMFFIFTVFDLIGRATSDIVSLDWVCKSARKLLTASYLRAVLFVPLFLLCNHRRNNNGGTPILFTSDWYPMLFTALFAYTNGLLISLTMMAWPCTVPKTKNEGAAIISFACSFGLLLGSVFSFLLVRVGIGA